MPIDRFLEDRDLSPEQRHILELAFNSTLRRLNLVDRNDTVCKIVARKVISIWESGARNAIAIAEIAARELTSRFK